MQHYIHMITHHRIGTDINGKYGQQEQQPLLRPATAVPIILPG
ncbi:hypothetical protein C427_4419 [Paraglaciecola psychrophila 170]|uniref:Uncharacterized protein n=1 Tax=Paraglaciecola psychrophila 170 TaxID=1129794 RepID=K6ZTB4_9ALTE|nr:hypothetical protein C427_4419 [Paraglaciecola psychrophila 170]GAC39151.1 hypothetical protein GPSY_3540 [Paraglaciecola psychrophila 170]